MRRSFNEPIPPDEVPTLLDSVENVRIWHLRRMIPDCDTWTEVAERAGVTKKTVIEWRRAHGITEIPYGKHSQSITRGLNK